MLDCVVYEELPGDMLGCYEHDTGIIRVDPRPKRRTRHITLVHELLHKAHKHGPCSLPVQVSREIMVESMTASYFIGFRDLLDATVQCGSVDEMARFLNVDHGLVYARWLSLTAIEQTILTVCGKTCIGIDTREPQRNQLEKAA